MTLILIVLSIFLTPAPTAQQGVYTSIEAALQHADTAEELDLSGKKNITFPPEIAELKKLHTLTMDGCRLDKVPAAIKRLPALEDLSLMDNQIRKVPAWLAKHPNLESVDLRDNPIDEAMAQSIREKFEEISVFLD